MRAVACVCLLAAWVTTFAQDSGDVYVHSFADTSCGAWAKSATVEWRRAQYIYWIRGFVSGYNHGKPSRYQIGLEQMPTNETLVLYVDKYCRDNPRDQFIAAAFQLVKELAPQPPTSGIYPLPGDRSVTPPVGSSTPPPRFPKPLPPTPPLDNRMK
jgi:hypothetical protein